MMRGSGAHKRMETVVRHCQNVAAQFSSPIELSSEFEALERVLRSLSEDEIATILDDPRYRALRNNLVSNRADYWIRTECDLAASILKSDTEKPLQDLFERHISREAYQCELEALRNCLPGKVLIVGSGPCPMTAVVLHQAFPGTSIICVDREPEACTLASAIVARLGLEDVEVLLVDGSDLASMEAVDCVLISLTVGATEAEKRKLIRHVSRNVAPNAVFGVRSAIGWGKLLYPFISNMDTFEVAKATQMRHPDQRSLLLVGRGSDFYENFSIDIH